MKRIFLILAIFLASYCHAQENTFFDTANAVLKASVTNGRVDYTSLKKDPEMLNKALEMAQNFKPDLDDPGTYKAFWINAYNLSVLKQVIAHYPIDSPLDVNGFFDKTTFSLAGKNITLNAIENQMLRAKFPNEARFHFALVCAGLGCPPIIDEAYRPRSVDDQMQKQTERALNDPEFIKVHGADVAVSEIFKWYKEDFDRQGGTVAFINRFRDDKLPKNALISYYDYNWKLNQTR